MYQSMLTTKVSRLFRPDGGRYACHFRPFGKEGFTSECDFTDLGEAMSFTSFVVRFLEQVAEGKVLDSHTQREVFLCQRPLKEVFARPPRVREAPADYGQLAMQGFDFQAARKETARRKKKVDETLARLRQLHDELNAQLYAHPTERPAIHSPSDVANLLQYFIGSLDHEEMWVVNLDTRNRVMSFVALYKGSVNSSQVRVCEVFRQAIVDNSPAIIVAHNHPSGDPTPSPEDVSVTRAILQAGKLLDIDLLDHLVIGAGRFVSLKERGLGF